jgi:hypothetical protein
VLLDRVDSERDREARVAEKQDSASMLRSFGRRRESIGIA